MFEKFEMDFDDALDIIAKVCLVLLILVGLLSIGVAIYGAVHSFNAEPKVRMVRYGDGSQTVTCVVLESTNGRESVSCDWGRK